jgi:PadR family transcriptional regulator PadR
MIDAQFKKGILDMCILQLLNRGDLYGYEVMKQVQQFFPEMHDGSVYTALRRLAFDGCLETYSGSVSNGPTRKYYHLTEKGSVRLKNDIESWHRLRKITQNLGII